MKKKPWGESNYYKRRIQPQSPLTKPSAARVAYEEARAELAMLRIEREDVGWGSFSRTETRLAEGFWFVDYFFGNSEELERHDEKIKSAEARVSALKEALRLSEAAPGVRGATRAPERRGRL